MKDIPHSRLLLKFQSKICKYPITHICPKFLYCQKMHAGLLGVKSHEHHTNPNPLQGMRMIDISPLGLCCEKLIALLNYMIGSSIMFWGPMVLVNNVNP